MTKYEGKHRQPPWWTKTKVIATIIATAGFMLFPTTYSWARLVRENPDPPPALPPLPGFAPPQLPSPIILTAAPIEEEEWIEDWSVTEPEVNYSESPVAVSVPDPPCWFGPGGNLGLTYTADFAYRVICNNFPGVYSYGGYRAGDQDHGTGNAVDSMCDSVTGDALAQFLIDNAGWLNVKYVIWEQRIAQAVNGFIWEPMEDRGGITANHYDHVHLSVY